MHVANKAIRNFLNHFGSRAKCGLLPATGIIALQSLPKRDELRAFFDVLIDGIGSQKRRLIICYSPGALVITSKR